ncbi:MAG: HAD family phosphatase [Pirellulales bacterium]
MSNPLNPSPRSPAIAAALFDFDGTLVDTMPLHFQAYREVLAAVDIELTSEDFFPNIGGNARETIPKFLRGRPCALSVSEIHARKKMRIGELLAEGPVTVLETAKLLDAFSGHLAMGLVSSGSRPGIDVVLDRLNWRWHFGTIVTGEDAVNGKPAPDLFLLAASRLGVSPERCIAFEDTDAGIAAANRAGMQAFDVRRTEAPSSRKRCG